MSLTAAAGVSTTLFQAVLGYLTKDPEIGYALWAAMANGSPFLGPLGQRLALTPRTEMRCFAGGQTCAVRVWSASGTSEQRRQCNAIHEARVGPYWGGESPTPDLSDFERTDGDARMCDFVAEQGDLRIEVPDLLLPAGKVTLVAAPSGKGKSVFLRTLFGTDARVEGGVMGKHGVLESSDVCSATAEMKPDIYKTVGHWIPVKSVPKNERVFIDGIIDRLKMREIVDKPTRDLGDEPLSTGERTRAIIISQAIKYAQHKNDHRTQIFSAGEPLAHLDVAMQKETRKVLEELAEHFPNVVVLIDTHNLDVMKGTGYFFLESYEEDGVVRIAESMTAEEIEQDRKVGPRMRELMQESEQDSRALAIGDRIAAEKAAGFPDVLPGVDITPLPEGARASGTGWPGGSTERQFGVGPHEGIALAPTGPFSG